MVKSYPKPVEDSLIAFICDFMREAIDTFREELLFFVILDNISLMDASSWALFEAITGSCENMVVVSCIQSNNGGDAFEVSD